MINIDQLTYSEINMALAKRLVVLRKRKKFSQKELSLKSGVTYASLRRFEETGDISLQSLTKLAIALGVEEEICDLFTVVHFDSIEEIINEQN